MYVCMIVCMYVCMYVKSGESWWRDDKSSTHGSLSRCICTECTLDVCSQFRMHHCHYSARASVYATQYMLFAMGNQVTSLLYADKKERILGTETSIIKLEMCQYDTDAPAQGHPQPHAGILQKIKLKKGTNQSF